MKKARYICLEGTEGVGKTTQTKKLADYLTSKGFKVLLTKEPGTNLISLTMKLREIMLDNQYDDVITRPAREFISQAIRSIHLEKLIEPSLYEYDYIVQDRGLLSGYAYGVACGNNFDDIRSMSMQNTESLRIKHFESSVPPEHIYDDVIYLKGNIDNHLQKALSCKKEFEAGDAIESRGNYFLYNVAYNMENYSNYFDTIDINVDNKSIEEVHVEIITRLGLKDL